MAYSYIRDKTQLDLKLMIVHVNRHETKILFVPSIQFMFSCLHVDLDIPYCYLFGAALIELVYWSGNYQTVTHLVELMAMEESPKPLLIEK